MAAEIEIKIKHWTAY